MRTAGVKAGAGAVPILVLGLSVARAGDLPGRFHPVGPEPVLVRSGFDWSGPYIGAHLGFGWGAPKFTDPVVTPGWSLRNDISGVIGGAQFGYNFQYGAWVFGFEFDISGAGISGDARDVGPFAGDRYRTRVNGIGTLAARAGYAWANHLIYVKAGGAGADTHYEYTPVSFGDSTPSRTDSTRWGYIVGVGWEYGITPHWMAKIEYNFLDFGKSSVSFDTASGPFGLRVDQQIHLIKFGANWRWNAAFNNGRPVAIYDGLAPGVY